MRPCESRSSSSTRACGSRRPTASFYQTFHVSKEETEGRFIYDLGNGQWDIPRLRTLLEEVLSNSHPVHDFEVEHDFPAIGKKIMLLNARRFASADSHPNLILLAIEDITDRKQAEAAVQTSEVRYRRLFQTAKDGILILDADTGKIIDANPFMTELLGYSHDEFLGKELWEIGLFRDKQASQAAYRELQEKGYIRYDHLPLETKDGQAGRGRVRQQRLSGGPPAQSLSATSGTSPNAAAWNGRRRSRRQRWPTCTAARTSSWRCSATNSATPSPPSSNAVHLLRLQKRRETNSSNKPAPSSSVRWDN